MRKDSQGVLDISTDNNPKNDNSKLSQGQLKLQGGGGLMTNIEPIINQEAKHDLTSRKRTEDPFERIPTKNHHHGLQHTVSADNKMFMRAGADIMELDEIECNLDEDFDNERGESAGTEKIINGTFVQRLKDFSTFNPSGNKGSEKMLSNSMMLIPSSINMNKKRVSMKGGASSTKHQKERDIENEGFNSARVHN